MDEAPMNWRAGGCHCGAVRFEVLAPDEIEARTAIARSAA